MSNTDGEDTESESGFDYLMRKAGEQVDNVIIKDLRKELASLREQLERAKYALSIMEGNRDRLFDQLKQKEDENRELVASIAVLLDELMYESTTGDFWMWARSNEKVPDRIMKIRNDNLSA